MKWFLKINTLFFLFALSKQADDLFLRVQQRINNDEITLFCNVTFSEQEFVYRLEWFKDTDILNVDNFEYLNSISKKKIEVVSYLKIKKNENSKGRYLCRIQTKKLGDFIINVYDRTIPVLESYELGNEINNQIPYSKTWIKLLMETEGSDIKIPCVYDPYKFQKNNKWYDYYNKSISSNDRIRTTDLYISINNLMLSDQNLYKCVNPNNEFYTILIVRMLPKFI